MKYTNWKQEPAKSALDRAVEAKLKELDSESAAGEIIILDGNLQDYVRYSKEKTKKMGVHQLST